MWKRLFLISLIQVSLFSNARAARIERTEVEKVIKGALEVEGKGALGVDSNSTVEDLQNCNIDPVPEEDEEEASYAGANGWLIVLCEGARGLENTNWTGKADPFCQVEFQGKFGKTFSYKVGLYKEDAVNGSNHSVNLNTDVAFDVKMRRPIDKFKVHFSVRDDDRPFGNGIGTFNGGELMGAKTVTLPPSNAHPVKFFSKHVSINGNDTGTWEWCPPHLHCAKPGEYVWKPTRALSDYPDIPGAWEYEGTEEFSSNHKGKISYRIRWCPYSNFDKEETKNWRRMRGTGCVKNTVFDHRHWVYDYAPSCVVQGLRQFSWSSYCSGGTCLGNTPARRTVRP